MNIYGYCRISTAKQSIDRQIRNIKAEYPTAHIVQEAYTGTSIFRPEWLKLYRILKAGDMVVFDSVSRMSRNPLHAWQFSSLSKKPPCSPWTLDTLCRLITFAHRCPLNLRHWQSGIISTMNLWPPTFSILNLVEAIQSPPMTRPMVFARSLDKIIVLALLKLHHSQPRSKRLWSTGKFVPISSQAFLRH